MAGNREGGLKTAKTIIEKHGKDFYREIGRKGGRNGHLGGFASEVIGRDGLTGWQRAKTAGRKGGTISRRGKSKKTTEGIENVQN